MATSRKTTPPARPATYIVESNFHAPLEQEDGTTRELVLPLKIGYKRMQRLLAESTSNIDDLERFVQEFGLTESGEAIEGCADYVELLAVSQVYFETFQTQAVARLGELRASSAS